MKRLIIIALNVVVATALHATPDRIEINGEEPIITRVNQRDEGKLLSQTVTIKMTDRRGKIQERKLQFFRKDYSGERKSVIFYQSPANVKGTAFLTFDYASKEKEDNQWLYLPALRKTRRISAANRGDYFLGTDLTYEDVKLGTKIGANDYNFETIRKDVYEGNSVTVIKGIPVTDKIAKELGYGKVEYTIDNARNIPLKIEYWDIAGNTLKVIHFKDVKKIQGIWTVQRMEAENFKTQHKTTLLFEEQDYQTPLDEQLFTEESLVRGL